MIKISDRAVVLLALINQQRNAYWIPKRNYEYLTIPGSSRSVGISVHGGDAASIKALWRHGLAREKKIREYASEITTHGRQVCESPEFIARLTLILTAMQSIHGSRPTSGLEVAVNNQTLSKERVLALMEKVGIKADPTLSANGWCFRAGKRDVFISVRATEEMAVETMTEVKAHLEQALEEAHAYVTALKATLGQAS